MQSKFIYIFLTQLELYSLLPFLLSHWLLSLHPQGPSCKRFSAQYVRQSLSSEQTGAADLVVVTEIIYIEISLQYKKDNAK